MLPTRGGNGEDQSRTSCVILAPRGDERRERLCVMISEASGRSVRRI